jgi:hypothetical protein
MALSEPMKQMLGLFAADLGAITCMNGFKNADRTLSALVERGLVRFEPVGDDPTVGEMVITTEGRDLAFYLLTGIVV